MLESSSRKKNLFFSLSVLFGFSTFYSSLSCAVPKEALNWFVLPPRLALSIFTGDSNLGKGDLLLPLVSNNADRVVYSNIQAKTGFNSNWSGSLGLGYRQVYQDHNIVGVYAFIDRNISSSGRYYWIASPGIEFLGKAWDFRLNAYFPVSQSRTYIGSDWADNFHNYDYLQFKQHEATDRYLSLYQNAGKGGDFEVGRAIPLLREAKIYGGGYYLNFAGEAKSILGISGRFELPLQSHCKLEFRYTNDNALHNMTAIGLRLILGSMPISDNSDIRQRLLDPVERNLATSNKDIGIITRESYQNVPAPNSGIERDNIWFYSATDGEEFDINKSADNCTYEHPCKNFKQSDVDAIASLMPGAYFYFSPGDYSLNGQISDYNGQGFFGRTEDYKEPANANKRSLFIGSFHLAGNGILDSLRFINDAAYPQNVAIDLTGQGTALLNNILVGTSTGNTSYPIGIKSYDTFINLTNSTIFAYSNNGDVTVVGIWADSSNGNQINLLNDSINILNQSVSDLNSINAFGIYAISSFGSNRVVIKNSQIKLLVDSATSTADSSAVVLAIQAEANNDINIHQSVLDAISKGGGNNTNAIGIIASATTGNNQFNLIDSDIKAQSDGNVYSLAEGIASYSFGGINSITLKQSKVEATGISLDSATSYGILAYANSLNASQINNESSIISGVANSPLSIQADVKKMD